MKRDTTKKWHVRNRYWINKKGLSFLQKKESGRASWVESILQNLFQIRILRTWVQNEENGPSLFQGSTDSNEEYFKTFPLFSSSRTPNHSCTPTKQTWLHPQKNSTWLPDLPCSCPTSPDWKNMSLGVSFPVYFQFHVSREKKVKNSHFSVIKLLF